MTSQGGNWLVNMTPLYTVEEPGEWVFAVYEDFIITVDHYEGFAEITFNVEI